MKLKILQYDPALEPYQKDLELRVDRYDQKLNQLLPDGENLVDFANGYQ